MTQKGDKLQVLTHFYYALNGRPWIFYWKRIFLEKDLYISPFRQVTDLIVQPFAIKIANIIGLIRAVRLRSSIWRELTRRPWKDLFSYHVKELSELGFLIRVERTIRWFSERTEFEPRSSIWNKLCWPITCLVFNEIIQSLDISRI